MAVKHAGKYFVSLGVLSACCWYFAVVAARPDVGSMSRICGRVFHMHTHIMLIVIRPSLTASWLNVVS